MSIYSKLGMTASTPSTRFYASAVGLGLDPTGAHFGMAPLKWVDINFSLLFPLTFQTLLVLMLALGSSALQRLFLVFWFCLSQFMVVMLLGCHLSCQVGQWPWV